jgi:Oligosaccaryltransferase
MHIYMSRIDWVLCGHLTRVRELIFQLGLGVTSLTRSRSTVMITDNQLDTLASGLGMTMMILIIVLNYLC